MYQFSPSFQYGLNVFEGMNSKKQYYAFLMDEHIERLFASAKLYTDGYYKRAS